ncbi:hypothetical protein [Ruegeria sp. AU67]|uniref:hypothetical protein n=1 Tax=Ruegeria sp. AU67 TaxID=2108530 RepID=UPI00135BD873|nr:hypothetical protein [Ruegeria sp. AU67]
MKWLSIAGSVAILGIAAAAQARDDCPDANYNLRGEWFNPINSDEPANEFQLVFETLDDGAYGCY